MRVLVVDDYPGAADIACVLLEMLGHEPRGVKTGTAALAQFEIFQPDVVVLDLGLPDLSGYEVAQRLRARRGPRTFIAAMTGWGDEAERVKSAAAGIDLHVLKPATAENLTLIIDAARARLSAAGEADQT